MSDKTIEQVLMDETEEWMAIDGVEGTAIGIFEDEPCIKIISSGRTDELRAIIPSSVGGYPVIIEEASLFRALDRK
ncbi:MAG: hypothetical protein ACYSWO_16575 [Planctomycetota bacterium]|jgi:hypothetical protein